MREELKINEDKLPPYRIYNGKWSKELLKKKKYEDIREKILNSFSDLRFVEEGHRYFIDRPDGTSKPMPCVSNVTHLFKPHFHAEEMAESCSNKYYDDPSSKYYHMTKEEILEAWGENSRMACEHGTERHEFGESLFYFMTYQYDKILPDFKERLGYDDEGKPFFTAIYAKEIASAKFYYDMPVCFIPILAETKVYTVKDEYWYSGTFDLLCYYDQTLDKGHKNTEKDISGLVCLDWKSNKDLYKNFNKPMLPPFEEYIDMPLSVYKLQLSAYQLCLEGIGLKVVARRIMWLLPNGTYSKIPLENLVSRLHNALIEYFDINKVL